MGAIAKDLNLGLGSALDEVAVLSAMGYVKLESTPRLHPKDTRVILTHSGRSRLEEIRKSLQVDALKVASPKTELGSNSVMVVHGRNIAARDELFSFIRSINLQPIDWDDAVATAGGGSPNTELVVRKAISAAGAVIVLLTGDDLVKLAPKLLLPTDGPLERDVQPQARPNVILELGMALMAAESKTIIFELEPTKPISDIIGRNTIRYDDGGHFRQALIDRLETAGCSVTRRGQQWMTAGNFASVLLQPAENRITPQEAQDAPSRLRLDKVEEAFRLAVNRLAEKDELARRLRLLRINEVDADNRVFLQVPFREDSLISHFPALQAEMSNILKRNVSLKPVKSIY